MNQKSADGGGIPINYFVKFPKILWLGFSEAKPSLNFVPGKNYVHILLLLSITINSIKITINYYQPAGPV